MAEYTELIHALQYCADKNRPDCSVCEYEAYDDCDDKLKRDAAAAIEELSKIVKDLTTKVECSPMQINEKAFDRAIEAWNERARKVVQDEA